MNQRSQRWMLRLGEYNMSIQYIQGKDNKVADFLIENQEVIENNIEGSVENNIDENYIDNIHLQHENFNDHMLVLKN